MQTEEQQKAHDLYSPPTRSNINLDLDTNSSDMGLDGFVLKSLYGGFIFLEYIDVTNGLFQDEDGFIKIESGTKVWRKAIVRMVSESINKHGTTEVGDIVMFPSDKGLLCGRVSYLDAESNEVKTAESGVFLDETRIFAKVDKVK